jgi:hypothetical protein
MFLTKSLPLDSFVQTPPLRTIDRLQGDRLTAFSLALRAFCKGFMTLFDYVWAPLDQTGVEFDEDKIDRIVNDVRDEVHLNACRATQGKYEYGAG